MPSKRATAIALASFDAPSLNPPPAKGLRAANAGSKPSFKAQMLQAREDAIIQAVNRLLAEKGFDLMTVDEVAAEVGIAKASLYKHFPSKEDLAAAAMVHMISRARYFLDHLPISAKPIDKLKSLVRWMMGLQLTGQMPSLPSQNSSLRANLIANKVYLEGLIQVSDLIGEWIVEAQKDGSLCQQTQPIVVLYTLYSRACDPVLEFLKAGGQHTDDEIIEIVIATCFDGLSARQPAKS